MKLIALHPILGAGLLLLPLHALAQDAGTKAERKLETAQSLGLSEGQAVAKGEEVVGAWVKCDYGFGDMQSDFKLVQSDGKGSDVERQVHLRMLEGKAVDSQGFKSAGDKSIVIFQSPKDVAGTSLLIHTNVRAGDSTWVYLPAVKRVKRISSENQSGNFAGTEFAFEDIASQEFHKFKYKWLRTEKCGVEGESATCDVVEQIPTYKNSGYSKQIVSYDECRHRKIDYYDLKGAFFKTQTFNDYRQYNGKQWRGHNNTMTNHRNGRKTHLIIPKFTYRQGFKESDFQSSALGLAD